MWKSVGRGIVFCLLLGAGGVASAKIVSPSLKVHPQPAGSDWCWAATTQTIAEYLGSTISQCEQAKVQNFANVDVDCCANPSACFGGGSPTVSLDAWGFKYTKNPGPPSFAQIQSWIDAGQPFITRFQHALPDPDTGAHFVVVDGYSTDGGAQQVHVLNSEATHDFPSVGFVDYSLYLLGNSGNPGDTGEWHIISGTTNDIYWAPSCPYDFAQLDSSSYGQCLRQRDHHGQWPSALASSNGLMSGSFGSGTSGAVAWGHTLTEMEQSIASQGSSNRPTFVTVNSATTVTYDAVWAPEPNAWSYLPEVDAATFKSQDAQLGTGYHVRDLFMYVDWGAVEYWVTWVQDYGVADRWSLAQEVNAFKGTDTTNRQAGYRLVRLSTYIDVNGVLNVAGLWFPSTVSDYRWVAGLSPSDYQAAFDKWVGTNGYTLDYISMWNGTYNAIFIKP